MRHADAGYDVAKACARKHNLDLPMLEKDQEKQGHK
jgi:urocanate hydratase